MVVIQRSFFPLRAIMAMLPPKDSIWVRYCRVLVVKVGPIYIDLPVSRVESDGHAAPIMNRIYCTVYCCHTYDLQLYFQFPFTFCPSPSCDGGASPKISSTREACCCGLKAPTIRSASFVNEKRDRMTT